VIYESDSRKGGQEEEKEKEERSERGGDFLDHNVLCTRNEEQHHDTRLLEASACSQRYILGQEVHWSAGETQRDGMIDSITMTAITITPPRAAAGAGAESGLSSFEDLVQEVRIHFERCLEMKK
jgi:hypothetical protein